MNFARHALWLFGLLAIFAVPLMAAEYTGRVVGVSDGDILDHGTSLDFSSQSDRLDPAFNP